jgi:hypothetical protein
VQNFLFVGVPVVASVGVLAVTACSLDGSGLARRDTGGNAAPPDSADPTPHATNRDASTSQPEPPDAARPRPDAGPATGGGPMGQDGGGGPGPDGDDCDRDHDGHRAVGACGGDDCCDTDRNTHPGLETGGGDPWFDAPNACGHWDYDCDGIERREYPTRNCALKAVATCGGDGFETDTACGVQAAYAVCTWALLACHPRDEDRVQRCR